MTDKETFRGKIFLELYSYPKSLKNYSAPSIINKINKPISSSMLHCGSPRLNSRFALQDSKAAADTTGLMGLYRGKLRINYPRKITLSESQSVYKKNRY